MEGVKNMGKYWHQILNSYPFHPSRTAIDLMEKYKRMLVCFLQLHLLFPYLAIFACYTYQ